MFELFSFISQLITAYIFLILASVIMSWLIGFGIINPYNQIARTIWNFLQAVTEPALGPIRRMMPDLGGIDVSPIILLLGLQFVQSVILPNLYRMLA
jgi:YggT family protein